MLRKDELDLLNALLTPFEEKRQKDKGYHLGGMCVMVSFVAAKILTEEKFRNTEWRFQRGRYGVGLGANEEYLDGHCWIVSCDGSIILDLTADQFGRDRIYFGPATSNYITVKDDFTEPYDTGFYEPARNAYIACRTAQRA